MGTFKDIDLIAPIGSFAQIFSVLAAHEEVVAATVVHGFSRSQIIIDLVQEFQGMAIDIDYQLTLNRDGLGCGKIALLTARSVAFSDLVTCQRDEAGARIIFLDPSSELLVLKNHAYRKPKDNYLARIAVLEANENPMRKIRSMFCNRVLNLLRRYALILRILPHWCINRFSSTRTYTFER